MNLLKKFYDTGIETASGGGTETAVLDKPEVKAPVSFAEAMGKGGVRVSNDSPAAKPIVNKTENKEEAKPVEKSEKVETTTTTSNAEKANSESLPPKQEKEEVAQPQKETVTQTQPSWQEVLKSQQPDNVLKELGFDDKTVKVFQKLKGFDKIDFFSNLIDEWKSKGDLKGYLKELSTDYSKMKPEEVMRHQLREEYPKASDPALNALFKKKIVEAYNLDSEDEAQVEEGKMLLEAEADKYRDTLIERQKTKLFPEVPEAAPPEPDLKAEQAKKDAEAWVNSINNDPFSQKVWENKKLVIGKGESKFSYPIVPEDIKNILFTDNGWQSTQYHIERNPDGSIKSAKPKIEEQVLIATFAQNPKKFLDDYAQHYLSMGGKAAIEPIENAKEITQPTVSHTEIKASNLAEGMAKGGTMVRGGM